MCYSGQYHHRGQGSHCGHIHHTEPTSSFPSNQFCARGPFACQGSDITVVKFAYHGKIWCPTCYDVRYRMLKAEYEKGYQTVTGKERKRIDREFAKEVEVLEAVFPDPILGYG